MKWLVLLTLIFSSLSFAENKNTYPWEWLKNKDFSSSYSEAIAQANLTKQLGDWVDSLNVVGSPTKIVEFQNKSWRYISGCKPHACGDTSIDIFYHAENKELYGLIQNEDVLYFIGSPSFAMKARLISILHEKLKRLLPF